MKQENNFFDRSLEFFTGVLYKNISKYPTFTHLKSYFNGCWYNFLIPNVHISDFDWSQAIELIDSEKRNGYDLSFYISLILMEEYRPVLEKKGHKMLGSEVYIFKTIDRMLPDISCKYENVTDSTIDFFVKMDKECFPDWENNEEYSRYFHEKSKIGGDPTIYNVLARKDGDYVGFGSAIISAKLGLSYLHNTGVVEKFRRLGIYSDLVIQRCNKSLGLGAKDIFAIVEEDSGSFWALSKLGFKPVATYYIYSGKI